MAFDETDDSYLLKRKETKEISAIDYNKISVIQDAKDYHAEAGNGINDGKYLGSHILIEYIQNQKLWKRKYKDNAIDKKESDAMKKGTAIHRCVLEKGAKFVDDYTVGYPTHEVKGVLQEYGADTKFVKEWMLTIPKDKPFISNQEMADILKINEIVKEHPEANDMISGGLCERVIKANYLGVDCHIRIDCFNPKYGICDLKKTRSMDGFLRDADRLGYWIQAGFYRKIFEIATGEKVPFNWIIAEDVEPFEVCTKQLDDGSIEYAQRLVESAILEFKESIKNNSFLTGREGLQIASWWRAEQDENSKEII